MSFVSRHLSRGRLVRLREVPRTARAALRLRRDPSHPRGNRTAAEESVALPRAAADRRRAAHRVQFRLHAARALRPPGEAARRARAVPEGRLGQPSDAVLQGSRRLRGRHARRRVGIQGPGLCVDGQPRQQRRRALRAPRARMLRLHPRQSRSGQGVRLRHLQADHSRHRRHLRRCEPAVHAGGRSVRRGAS